MPLATSDDMVEVPPSEVLPFDPEEVEVASPEKVGFEP
jgi:hypothetical protein